MTEGDDADFDGTSPRSQQPLGALSVVVSAILSSIFLKEKLTFFGWIGELPDHYLVFLASSSDSTPSRLLAMHRRIDHHCLERSFSTCALSLASESYASLFTLASVGRASPRFGRSRSSLSPQGSSPGQASSSSLRSSVSSTSCRGTEIRRCSSPSVRFAPFTREISQPTAG